MSVLNKLTPIVEDLKSKAALVDKINEKKPSHKYFKEKRLFSETLFSSYSDKFVSYALEIEKKLARLAIILKHNNQALSLELITQIEHQIAALTNALNANDAIHHEAEIKHEARKQFFAKKAAKTIMQSSHELYQTLAQYHEFERRLQAMINERTAAQGNSPDLNQEILALHQRLGRCRKAISQVERQIEQQEKTNS